MANKELRNQAEVTPIPDSRAILEKLTLISKSLGILALRFAPKRHKSNKERIHFLDALGFDRNEISAILSTTPGTVSVSLSMRKAHKQRGKAEAKPKTKRRSADGKR